MKGIGLGVSTTCFQCQYKENEKLFFKMEREEHKCFGGFSQKNLLKCLNQHPNPHTKICILFILGTLL